MLLTLKVMSCRGLPPPEEISACFDQKNGTIGRSDDNDLVLPDPENFISRRHANITYESGRYSLLDTSLSGTVIDQSEQPLKKSAVELRDGMRIDIGEYEIIVHIGEAADAGPFSSDSLESDGLLTDIMPPVNSSPLAANSPENFLVESPEFDSPSNQDSDDLLAAFNDEEVVIDPLAALEESTPVQDNFDPPKSHFEPGGVDELPEDFNFEDLLNDSAPEAPESQEEFAGQAFSKDAIENPAEYDFSSEKLVEEPIDVDSFAKSVADSEANEPLEAPKIPNAKSSSANVRSAIEQSIGEGGQQKDRLFDLLLESIGVSPSSVANGSNEEQIVRLIGKMFREMVEGLMALLMSRAELKSQFRMSVTTIRPAENNPLKFSVSTTDALKALLTPGQQGFLNPVDAVHDGFNDVSNHQLAMIAGIQASMTQMFKNFEPERFAKQSEGGVFSNKDAKSWELYSKSYQRLVSEATEEFFGDTFVDAYAKQMQVLQSINKGK